MSELLLNMEGVEKYFPGVHALKKCCFDLRKGEVHALVGENGAGKSTLMKVLTGIFIPESGQITLESKCVNFKSPRQAQLAGISIVHQELNLMNHLTAAQNIFIGRESDGLFLNEKSINDKTLELFKKLNIKLDPEEKVGNLSVSHQQMIEIAKAISYDAKIIIFDEPTATLTDVEIEELFKIMNELKSQGVGMVYISHRMDEIKKISDRVTVLRDGEYIGTEDSAKVKIDDIIHMMVGRITYEEHKKISDNKEKPPVVLKVENMSSKDVNNVSFELHKGEILGFAGLIGAGRTELARLIFGADKKTTGEIYLDGKKVNVKSPHDAVRLGIGYLSEDRKRYGLSLGMSVANNIVMPNLDEYITAGIISEKKIKKIASEYVDKINIKTPSVGQLVKNLSGGNQQKVIIAKWLLKNSDILIFDEPTRGIDVGAKSEIYKIINKLAKSGKSIIIISSELPELLRMSDRVLVMCEGTHTATLELDQINQNTIMKYATQH
ncbi:MAG: sugar ABC transporter ATP-binding protein [Clostridiales bacterium]|nr:sugar ABC transporter ATP-binding protein [Clostridiales bacterium]